MECRSLNDCLFEILMGCVFFCEVLNAISNRKETGGWGGVECAI